MRTKDTDAALDTLDGFTTIHVDQPRAIIMGTETLIPGPNAITTKLRALFAKHRGYRSALAGYMRPGKDHRGNVVPPIVRIGREPFSPPSNPPDVARAIAEAQAVARREQNEASMRCEVPLAYGELRRRIEAEED